MAFYPFTVTSGGGSGTVTSVTAADTSIVVTGTPTINPQLATAALNVIAADHPTAADWSNNSHKITSLANGSAAQDAAAFGQLLAGGSGAPLTTKGDLLYENATPAPARLGIGTAGQVLATSTGGLPVWAAAPVDWLNVVTAYGADPTGAADSTTPIQNAINACIAAGGGVVYFPAGTYKVTSTLSVVITTGQNNSASYGTPVALVGAGRWATFISSHVTGDCIRFYGTEYPWGSAVLGLTIDGLNSGTGSAGLHFGDIFRPEFDCAVQNFNGTGGIGFHFDNNYFFTEQMTGQIFTANCTQQVVFDNSANTSGNATGSFDRCGLKINVDDYGNQDCLAFKNGASIANPADMSLRGNASKTTAANTAAVLRFGNGSEIINGTFTVGVELDGALANAPQSINFGTTASGSGIIACTGIIDFSVAGTFAASNIATQGTFKYYGPVLGDSTLQGQLVTEGAFTASAVRTVTAASYSISTYTDFLILGNTASNNVTITMPDATTCKGQMFAIACINDSNNVIIDTVSAQTIATQASGYWQLASNGNLLLLQSDGANWQTVATAGVASVMTLLSGTDTQPAVAATGGTVNPALTSGTAAQLNNTFDVMFYITVNTTSTVSLAIGPTSTPAHTIVASSSKAAGSMISCRVPCNWWVQSTFTAADVTLLAVAC